MLIYAVLLCAIVAMTFLVQILAYSRFHQIDLGTDICELLGLPIESEFEYEQAVETV
jgi:hypothetical protein